ncbi:endolytic transglycosylase MltG [Gallaecimonas mangrovi]|uniref:endolytic transglycosylase MltG n=1 Tax=Gallaecimonas mangrovi TaxID=2291597 RepID=UPI000E202790|nr:endolytic transglycosylase MltG [Gallaecimonas mangrovi]
MRTLLWILAALMAALVAGIAFVTWQYRQTLETPLPLSKAQTIHIKAGTSAYRLVRELQEKGWVKSRWPYKVFVKLHPELADIRAGCYAVEPGMRPQQLLANAAAGKEQTFLATLVDGEKFSQWLSYLQSLPELRADKLSKQQLAAKLGVDNPEGWLMPDTYQYRCGDDALSILTQAHDAMTAYLATVWPKREDGLPFEDSYQALIMASIVEKETAAPKERPLIASVFINRLQKGMRLQTDPTVIYGLGDKYDGNITRADLKTPTPYNTYVIKGLPPTPIAMPSRASIDAVLHPDSADYLYFVAKGDGTHVFSKTLREHINAVNRYQRGHK